MLKIENFSVGHEQLLYHISHLELNAGDFVAVIGANGSGKSTFFQALVDGAFSMNQAVLNGVDLSSIPLTQRSKLITLVDNHFLGLPYLSVLEYLNLGRYVHTSFTGRLKSNDRDIVARFAEELRVTTLLNRFTSTLSDGERQRVSIAKALIQETPIVLLDEPTAFLDYPTKHEVMELLAETARVNQRIVLIASHDIDFCVKHCTRFALINKQKQTMELEEALNKEELIKRAFPTL